MKKNIMLVMATIIVATFFLTKPNKEEKMSDITLANIEALAQDESGDWYCVGEFYTCLLDEQGRIYGKKYNLK